MMFEVLYDPQSTRDNSRVMTECQTIKGKKNKMRNDELKEAKKKRKRKNGAMMMTMVSL